jgi:hypothetical protein
VEGGSEAVAEGDRPAEALPPPAEGVLAAEGEGGAEGAAEALPLGDAPLETEGSGVLDALSVDAAL